MNPRAACQHTRYSHALVLLASALGSFGVALGTLLTQSRAWAADETFAVHGQMTYVVQRTGGFHAPYAGTNSLSPGQSRETFDATLYVGGKLWSGSEVWINPEIDQGFGLDNTLGVAGFPSGEAYKVGKSHPYLRLPRAFVRQTLNLGDALDCVGPGLNQLKSHQSSNRVVVTAGKVAVGDVFDTNQYAHDPRVDFLNWTAADAGSFDYAADAWGYTYGAAVEWYQGASAVRAGVFDLSDVPNSAHLDPTGRQFQMILELERRYQLGDQGGRVLVTAYQSRGRMGLLDEATHIAHLTGDPADIKAVRQYRSRTGVHVTLEQQITKDLGAFARIGAASGNVEAYEFTDVDRTVSAGLALKGARWHRSNDTLGVATIANGLSAARQRFLNAGGLGILVGDGQLPHAGTEQILETYYAARLFPQSFLTLDYQFVNNPAYNRDRGPISIWAVRLHAQF
jgi:high affinity Mn2+ porin